eukprot:5171947-Amphidinium_carterae.1
MPKYYRLAVALQAAGLRLRVGAVNCAVQRDLCGAFKVLHAAFRRNALACGQPLDLPQIHLLQSQSLSSEQGHGPPHGGFPLRLSPARRLRAAI